MRRLQMSYLKDILRRLSFERVMVWRGDNDTGDMEHNDDVQERCVALLLVSADIQRVTSL